MSHFSFVQRHRSDTLQSLDPKTKKHSVDVYPETSHIGTIALREKEGVSLILH